MRRRLVVALTLLPAVMAPCNAAVASTADEAGASAGTPAAPPLAGATLAGSARLSVWGFDVYQARLWVRPGFAAADFARHVFALELAYLRDFTSEAIASRSLDEMRRIGPVSETQAGAWRVALRRVLPDVRKGDRIAGLHLPGVGARFLVNGQLAGDIRDASFAPLFFGIWLSPATSEPRLREALLAPARR